MVNSGRCRSPRSRSRNTRANSKIFFSPAASSFLQANSGEVRKIPRRARAVGTVEFGARRMQMGLIAGRNLQNRRSRPRQNPAPRTMPATALVMALARSQKRLDVGVPGRRPPWRRCGLPAGFSVMRSICAEKRLSGIKSAFRPFTSPRQPVKRWHRRGKISMLQPETASPASGRSMSGSVPGQNIRKNSFESHRQFYSQGQRHRARRQALRGSDRREHPSRQGNPGQPDRNAPNQRRGEDLRALQDHRPGREGDHRGPEFQLPLQGCRRLPLHEQRQLRSGPGARGHHRQRRAPTCRKT